MAVSTFKAETYRFLRLARPTDEEMADGAVFPPGSIHLPHWVENEWLKQVVAEQLVTVRTKRALPGWNGRSCASATRRWTAGSMPAPPPGSQARIAGPTTNGVTSRINSGRAHGNGWHGAGPPTAIRTPGKRRSDWLGRRGGWF